eukprot:g7323.t1
MGDKLDFDEFVFKAVNNKETNRKKRFRDDENAKTKRKAFKRSAGGWKDALYSYIRGDDDDDDDDAVMLRTKIGVFVRDKYAKAKIHVLLLPNETTTLFERKDGVADLKKSDLKELREFHETAKTFVRERYKGKKFRIGYHAIPSMRPLHLHIISCDFQSDRLKNKKHWNSFTTSFFMETDKIEAELKRVGRVRINRDAMNVLLKSSLHCHRCNEIQRNVPTLKRHIEQCRSTKLNFDAFMV